VRDILPSPPALSICLLDRQTGASFCRNRCGGRQGDAALAACTRSCCGSTKGWGVWQARRLCNDRTALQAVCGLRAGGAVKGGRSRRQRPSEARVERLRAPRVDPAGLGCGAAGAGYRRRSGRRKRAHAPVPARLRHARHPAPHAQGAPHVERQAPRPRALRSVCVHLTFNLLLSLCLITCRSI